MTVSFNYDGRSVGLPRGHIFREVGNFDGSEDFTASDGVTPYYAGRMIGVTAPGNTFDASSAPEDPQFTALVNVGDTIVIREGTDNAGSYTITAVVSDTELEVDGALVVSVDEIYDLIAPEGTPITLDQSIVVGHIDVVGGNKVISVEGSDLYAEGAREGDVLEISDSSSLPSNNGSYTILGFGSSEGKSNDILFLDTGALVGETGLPYAIIGG